jgi:hypothetical protein
MAPLRLKPPEKIVLLDLDEKKFDIWIEAYTDYIKFTKPWSSSELAADPSMEIAFFYTVAGLEIRNLAKGLSFDDTYIGVVTAIKKYLRPVSNLVVERNTFFSMCQENEEDLQEYLVRLKKCVTKCNFKDTSVDTLDNQMVRDQFIKGIQNQKIRVSLLKEVDPSLKVIEQLANSIFAAEQNNKIFDHQNDRILYYKQPSNVQNSAPFRPRNDAANCAPNQPVYASNSNFIRSSQYHSQPPQLCFTCQKPGHVSKNCYKNAKCTVCQKIGHTSNFCQRKHAVSEKHTA